MPEGWTKLPPKKPKIEERSNPPSETPVERIISLKSLCPHCQQVFAYASNFKGSSMVCPHCLNASIVGSPKREKNLSWEVCKGILTAGSIYFLLGKLIDIILSEIQKGH